MCFNWRTRVWGDPLLESLVKHLYWSVWREVLSQHSPGATQNSCSKRSILSTILSTQRLGVRIWLKCCLSLFASSKSQRFVHHKLWFTMAFSLTTNHSLWSTVNRVPSIQSDPPDTVSPHSLSHRLCAKYVERFHTAEPPLAVGELNARCAFQTNHYHPPNNV